MMRKLTAIIIGIVFSLSACKKDEPLENEIDYKLKTGKVFYDKPDQKQWRHKVNSTEDLEKYTNLFPGIEFDLVYDSVTNTLQVEHDPDPYTTILLDDYWGAIINPENYYYWLDIKNLTSANVNSVLLILDSATAKYYLKENVICESRNPGALSVLGEYGYYTSYWIPHFNEDCSGDACTYTIKATVEEAFKQYQFNAISCHSYLLSFVNEFLPDYTVHVWTNGLIGNEDKNEIKAIEENSNVKVILTDYEEPF